MDWDKDQLKQRAKVFKRVSRWGLWATYTKIEHKCFHTYWINFLTIRWFKNISVFGLYPFYFNESSTQAGWTPQICVKPDDHVPQHDYNYLKENIWPSQFTLSMSQIWLLKYYSRNLKCFTLCSLSWNLN